jgi:hypothetical protein
MRLQLIPGIQAETEIETNYSDVITTLVDQYNEHNDLRDKYPSYLYSIIQRLCKSAEHPEPFFPVWDDEELRIYLTDRPQGVFMKIMFNDF